MMGKLYLFFHNNTKLLRIFPEKRESVEEDFKKRKINSYINHYIKVWRLMFDVYKTHVERGELLIKVSSVQIKTVYEKLKLDIHHV